MENLWQDVDFFVKTPLFFAYSRSTKVGQKREENISIKRQYSVQTPHTYLP